MDRGAARDAILSHLYKNGASPEGVSGMTRFGRLGRFLASGPAVEPADRGAGQGEGAAAVCEAVRGLWADVGGGVEVWVVGSAGCGPIPTPCRRGRGGRGGSGRAP